MNHGVGQNYRIGRAEINVVTLHNRLVEWREVVYPGSCRTDFEYGIREIVNSVKETITGFHVDISAGVRRGPVPGGPDSPSIVSVYRIRRMVNPLLRQRTGRVGHHPALPYPVIPVRPNSDIHRAVIQQQCRALKMSQRVKIRSCNYHRTPEFLSPCNQIQRVQPVDETWTRRRTTSPDRLLRLHHHVDGVRRGIDDRR